jgi:hypothetical protein
MNVDSYAGNVIIVNTDEYYSSADQKISEMYSINMETVRGKEQMIFRKVTLPVSISIIQR